MFYIVAETTRTVVTLSTRQTRKRSLRHRPQPIPGGGAHIDTNYNHVVTDDRGHPVAPLEAWPLRRRRSAPLAIAHSHSNMNSPLLQLVGSKQHAGTHHDIDLSDSLAHKSAPCASCDLLSSAEGSPTSVAANAV